MKRYIITNTVLSRAKGSTPLDVTWYRGDDKAKAMAALLHAINQGDDSDSTLPESVKFDIIATRMEQITLPDPPDTLTYRIDWPEDQPDEPVFTANCCWYDNQYQPWSRVECGGRMALVTMVKNGRDEMGAPMCEAHVNAYNDNVLSR